MRVFRTSLVLCSLLVARALEVHEPSFAAGYYDDTRCDFAPEHYDVTAPGVIATSCPCEWSMDMAVMQDGGALLGNILVIPGDICDNACPAESAACAAKLANASGVLLTRAFDPSSAMYPGNSLETTNENGAFSIRFAAFDGAHNASCAEEPLPTAYIPSNTSALLIDAALDNNTELIAAHANDTFVAVALLNLTMSAGGSEEEDAIDCDTYQYVPLVYLLLVPVWWLLTVLWTWNTYRAHAAHARDLHRLLCWVPIMQFVHAVLSLFHFSGCPWENTLALVYTTFWAVVSILKEPVALLCLLLVSKGWCITRNTLQRREVCFAGCNLTLLYAAVSVWLSMQSVLATVPMVMMYLAMLGDISLSILANLRILKAQLLALRSFGIDPCTTPAHRKYVMFVRLAKFTALYVLCELTIHLSFDGRDSFFWLYVLLHQLMELGIAVGIGYTFRAQPFNVLFQQVQQVALELAEQLLPSITTVEISPDVLSGPDLIAWRSDLQLNPADASMPATLVVLNPGDKEIEPASTAPTCRYAPSRVSSTSLPPPPGAPPQPADAAVAAAATAAPPPPRAQRSRVGGGGYLGRMIARAVPSSSSPRTSEAELTTVATEPATADASGGGDPAAAAAVAAATVASAEMAAEAVSDFGGAQ